MIVRTFVLCVMSCKSRDYVGTIRKTILSTGFYNGIDSVLFEPGVQGQEKEECLIRKRFQPSLLHGEYGTAPIPKSLSEIV